MILPRSNLLWWTLGLLVPLAIVAAAAPPLAGIVHALAATLMLLPVLDALLPSRKLREISIEPRELSRLTKGVAGPIHLRVLNPSATAMSLRLAVPLPADLGCRQEDQTFLLPAAPVSVVSFDCLPIRRGSYQATTCYIGRPTPMGFWTRRMAKPLNLEARVFPNLLVERTRLAALFLNRGALGIHARRQVGKGREFERLREYVAGDAYDEIHWRATAKRRRPVTKIYQVERTQEVYVIIDSSRLSARPAENAVPSGKLLVPGEKRAASSANNSQRGTRNSPQRPETGADAYQTLLERYIVAGLILGMVAQRQGDHFGILSFSDRVDAFVRAGSGASHYRACRHALYDLQPRIVTPDFSEVFSFIRLRLRRRALLVFLTSLDDPVLSENVARSMPLISRHHLVLMNMIRPPGVWPLFSHDDVATTDDVCQALAGHIQWNRLRELEKVLKQRGASFRLLPSAGLCPELVSQYMGVKQRQLL